MMRRPDQAEAKYTLEIIPRSDIAIFRWVGPITLADRKKNLGRMAEFCGEHNVHRIIVDGREQIPKTDVMDSFELGKDVPNEMRGLTIAVVHRADDESLRFIETVAFNRGARTRAFQDFDEAREWLESFNDTTESPDAEADRDGS